MNLKSGSTNLYLVMNIFLHILYKKLRLGKIY